MSVEVLAPFEPLATLARRSPTLDGSVPLRVAQACVPLLEGNAFGFQVVFQRPLVARTRLGRVTLVVTPELEHVDRVHRASARYLVEQGVVRGAWRTFFERGWWASERGRLRIWTGLCVRPARGTWLRASGTKNRGVHGLGADEIFVLDDGELVPLVIDFTLPPGDVRLVGEVATLAPVRPGVRAEIVPAASTPDLLRAHAAFYDEAYFAKKRGEAASTRKYRRAVARGREAQDADADGATTTLRVAHVAGPRPTIEHEIRVLSGASPTPTSRRPDRPLDRVRFANAVGFSARWDGYSLAVEPDRSELAAGARAVESALGPDFAGAHRGALLYLTKYFTPHPPGEPHFFVKPWAFVQTGPGWSTMLEGPREPAFDVMRGVVRTDAFHAAPAVFHLHGPKTVELPRGAHLLDAFAVPRALDGATLRVRKEA